MRLFATAKKAHLAFGLFVDKTGCSYETSQLLVMTVLINICQKASLLYSIHEIHRQNCSIIVNLKIRSKLMHTQKERCRIIQMCTHHFQNVRDEISQYWELVIVICILKSAVFTRHSNWVKNEKCTVSHNGTGQLMIIIPNDPHGLC